MALTMLFGGGRVVKIVKGFWNIDLENLLSAENSMHSSLGAWKIIQREMLTVEVIVKFQRKEKVF